MTIAEVLDVLDDAIRFVPAEEIGEPREAMLAARAVLARIQELSVGDAAGFLNKYLEPWQFTGDEPMAEALAELLRAAEKGVADR